jgi:hypothetical protein
MSLVSSPSSNGWNIPLSCLLTDANKFKCVFFCANLISHITLDKVSESITNSTREMSLQHLLEINRKQFHVLKTCGRELWSSSRIRNIKKSTFLWGGKRARAKLGVREKQFIIILLCTCISWLRLEMVRVYLSVCVCVHHSLINWFLR